MAVTVDKHCDFHPRYRLLVLSEEILIIFYFFYSLLIFFYIFDRIKTCDKFEISIIIL